MQIKILPWTIPVPVPTPAQVRRSQPQAMPPSPCLAQLGSYQPDHQLLQAATKPAASGVPVMLITG